MRTFVAVAAMALGGGFASAASANDDVMKLQQDPAQVIQPNMTYNGWNYSPLDKINTTNVKDLSVAWTFQLGVTDETEASPLIVGTTMYLVTPKPNRVYALDLTKDGAIKWEFRPDASNLSSVIQVACCGAQTRGMNYAEGKLFFQTLGGHVYALDAETGKVVWDTQGSDLLAGQTMTSNGMVIHDLYITGVAGGEFGVRGYVTAYDINTGKQRWRYYSMGPNNEVGIGSRFKPFYADDQIANPAADSWYGDSWKTGGGSVWGFFTYDADLNMFYYSTGNCGPWNPDYRREFGKVDLDANGGLKDYRNNYCASMMARDATTGELIWAYNMNPQDSWDLDEPLTSPLVDLTIDGKLHKAVIKAARNGYFYVWDRQTGELLTQPWPFVYNNIMKGVDMKTGRPEYDIDKILFTNVEDRRKYTQAGAVSAEDQAISKEEAALYGDKADDASAKKGTEADICPSIQARNWENDAWSPQTGLLYTSTQFACRAMRVTEGTYKQPQTAEGYKLYEWAGDKYALDMNGKPSKVVNQLQANDPVTGKTVWHIDYTQPTQDPILATAGGLLFVGGDDEGVVRGIDAKKGDVLWQFRTGSGSAASPVTYIGPDGGQYMAFISSSKPGAVAVAADAAPDAGNRYSREGSTLYVFKLPGSANVAAK
jgi:PQQ-dependent dehydrogenase (methanol/ethanol family)